MGTVERPETKYVAVGDADVAYQVFGDGPGDLLFCYGLGSHIDNFWDVSIIAEFLEGLASFSRVIVFDRRGTGASDAVPSGDFPTWEQWAEDIGAVLDAAGSKSAAILAPIDAGPMAILYAVSHPERVSALILQNTTARYKVADDYPIGYRQEAVDFLIEAMSATWGTQEFWALANPGVKDPAFLDVGARLQRSSVTPRGAAAQYNYLLNSLDVRQVLSLIQAPTLILHVTANPFISIEHGRYLAECISGAKFVELSGTDLHPGSNGHVVVEEVANFLTGLIAIEPDRALAAVLFTDIVGSTAKASAVGDRQWRNLLETHDSLARTVVEQNRGHIVKTTGDGVLATFDGPGRAIRCAIALREALRPLGLEIRAGLHTGEVEVRGDDIAGIGVHIAARVLEAAGPGDLVVSPAVPMLVAGSGIEFEDRGEHELKGVPGAWKLFAVRS